MKRILFCFYVAIFVYNCISYFFSFENDVHAFLDFCYLVNPYFPPKQMLAEIKSNFDKLITTYPSGMSVNALLMSKYFGISTQFICVGNGAAELIKSICEQINGSVGVIIPSFEEYINRIENKIVVYKAKLPDFRYTARDLISYFDKTDVSTLIIVNPDNPSGNFLTEADVNDLILWSTSKNIRLVIDESFIDFSDQNFSLLRDEILKKYPSLVVVKSISKSYGVPGLRLGVVASADIDFISNIRKDVAIWNINSFAEYYLQIYGKYIQKYKEACDLFKTERRRFFEELKSINNLRVIESQANYFLCEVLGGMSSSELTNKLIERKILIKDCCSKKGFDRQNYIRIAIRDKLDNDMFVRNIRDILQ